MSTHTQGKLCVSSDHPRIIKTLDFMGETSVVFGSVSGYDGSGFFPPNSEALHNARRLVACWNACEGVPTDVLEQIEGFGNAALPYHELKAQRDELLEALEIANESLCDLPLMDPRIVAIRAAIAKATGQKGGA